MRQELSIFINENYSLEKQGLFNKAFSVFEDYSIEDHDVSFLELISEFDSRDYLDIIDNFESLIRNLLIDTCKQQGVILVEDCSLEILLEITAGLFDIQYYENKEDIIKCIEVDSESEEKLSNILNMVTLLSVDNLLLNIESVDSNIFNLILETCSYSDSNETESEELTKSDKDIVFKLKEFREFCKDPELIAFKIIRKGFRVKLSFDFYNRYLKNMVTDFSNLEQVAKEYFAVLIMAKESYLNPINHFRKISSTINEDITLITKLDIQISKIYNDFDKFCISKI